MKTSQQEAIEAWFKDYDTISLAQANAGIPDPADEKGVRKVRIARVAPLILVLRNAGWVISTGRDEAGNSFYRVVTRPDEPIEGGRKLDPLREEGRKVKKRHAWRCTKPGCISEVIPDEVTSFDARYSTGKCLTHGKTVIARE